MLDADAVRRQHLVHYLAIIVMVAAGSYALVYAALGMAIAAAGAGSGLLITAATRARYPQHISDRAAAHSIAFAAFVALVAIALDTGTVHSPANAWFILCPLLPSMMMGRRAGLPWIVAVSAWMALASGLQLSGLAPASAFPALWMAQVYAAVVPATLAMVVLGIAWSYDVSKEDAFARVEAAREEADAAREVAQRAHEGARRLLDAVSDGLLMVWPDGRLQDARSRAVDGLLGSPVDGERVWELFGRTSARFADWLELGWQGLSDGWMPADVVVAQFPTELDVEGRHLRIRYVPVLADEALDHVLVVVADCTAEVEAERAQEQQRELMVVFGRIQTDRSAVVEFFAEADRLVERFVDETSAIADDRRDLHTLKGNTAIFGLTGFSRALHELEDRIGEEGAILASDREAIRARWEELHTRVEPLLADGRQGMFAVPAGQLEKLIGLGEDGADGPTMAAVLRRWTLDTAAVRLERLASQTRALATRLGKEHVVVEVDADDVAFPHDVSWRPFWAALVHVVRNALDHGVEPVTERRAAGKADQARVVLRARADDDRLAISVGDDGAGIRWEVLRARAAAAGLPHTTHEDLTRAIFATGVSSATEVTEISGRGVGAGAVLSAVERLGGRVEIDSVVGEGTTFRFVLPLPGTPAPVPSANRTTVSADHSAPVTSSS